MSDKEKKKVWVCKKCCGFDVDELDGLIKKKHVSTKCNGKCLKKHKELKGKFCGYLDGEFVVCDTKEEFFARIAAIAAKPDKN